METFGLHLTVDAQDCNKKKLVDTKFIYRLLDKLPSVLSMNKMTLPYVVEWKDKWAETPGISGFVMIAESHISIHTFPEQNYAFVDMFSCKDFNAEEAIQFILNALGASDLSKTNVIIRGEEFHKRLPQAKTSQYN